jgi:hypothetical protein
MDLKLYEVSILNKPESAKVVCALYRRRAERLYLEHIGKYTADLLTDKLDVTVLTKQEQIVQCGALLDKLA